jgi:hypothetical protein
MLIKFTIKQTPPKNPPNKGHTVTNAESQLSPAVFFRAECRDPFEQNHFQIRLLKTKIHGNQGKSGNWEKFFFFAFLSFFPKKRGIIIKIQ